jgi:RNA-directed DNA polymerase
VRKFERDLERNLIRLESELRSTTYQPHPLKDFVIHDPKTRIISSSHFRDRVVHHAVCNIIEPIIEKTFIYDSYASRKGKGTHAAIERFDKFMRKISSNGRLVNGAQDNNMIIGYVLKADVKHYFDTVDHKILMTIIRKKIHDERILRLIGKILANHRVKDKGMPIGNLTSQFFANVYLNELDHFVKHRLRAKFYIRYLDDFVILHSDKDVLRRWEKQINEFLYDRLKLELHPDKTKIYPLRNGVNFLGFRIFFRYKLLKKSNRCLIRKRIEQFIILYEDRIIEKPEILERLEGWEAYAMHANTHNFRKDLKRKLDESMIMIDNRIPA